VEDAWATGGPAPSPRKPRRGRGAPEGRRLEGRLALLAGSRGLSRARVRGRRCMESRRPRGRSGARRTDSGHDPSKQHRPMPAGLRYSAVSARSRRTRTDGRGSGSSAVLGDGRPPTRQIPGLSDNQRTRGRVAKSAPCLSAGVGIRFSDPAARRGRTNTEPRAPIWVPWAIWGTRGEGPHLRAAVPEVRSRPAGTADEPALSRNPRNFMTFTLRYWQVDAGVVCCGHVAPSRVGRPVGVGVNPTRTESEMMKRGSSSWLTVCSRSGPPRWP
jgi:hypothetical protein